MRPHWNACGAHTTLPDPYAIPNIRSGGRRSTSTRISNSIGAGKGSFNYKHTDMRFELSALAPLMLLLLMLL